MGRRRHLGAQGEGGGTPGTHREGPLCPGPANKTALTTHPPLPHCSLNKPFSRGGLWGVACWTASLASRQGLTFDHIGSLQGSQEWEGVESVVLLPERKAAVPPALYLGLSLGTSTSPGLQGGFPP